MAISILPNNTYYKINIEQSYINNGNLFISLTLYENIEERDKEKNWKNDINIFEIKMTNYLNNLSIEAEEEINIYNKLQYLTNFILNNYIQIKTTEEIETVIIEDYYLNILLLNGYNIEWLSSPVIVLGQYILNCGEIDQTNEIELNGEYLYNRLKEISGKNIDL